VWWRSERDVEFRPLTADDVTALRARFAERDREHLLGRA
jgi:hypothetical protein